MRCPACKTENPRAAAQCSQCGGTLARRRRRSQVEEADLAGGDSLAGANRASLRAYRVCVAGLVPGLGLLLGPLAMLLGALALRQGKADRGFTAQVCARAAVKLGALIALTNWLGLTLMLLGLR